jgi:putative sterol carrier protein
MDFEALERLINEFLPGFVQNGYWRWKYLLNKDFDHSFIGVTEKNGEIVGCIHWLPGRIKIASNIDVRANLNTDGVTVPRYRRRGVIKSMMRFMRNTGILESKGAIIDYAYVINERFARAIGFTPIKSSTRSYQLLLSWKRTLKKIEKADKSIKSNPEVQKMLEGLNLVLLFRLKGAPPLTISITKEGVSASEKEPERANLVIESNLGTFISLLKSEGKKWKLLRAMAAGKLKVKGSLFDLVTLWQRFNAVLEVLRIAS